MKNFTPKNSEAIFVRFRSGPHEDTGSHNHKGKSEGKLKQSPSKSSHDTSSSSPKKGRLVFLSGKHL